MFVAWASIFLINFHCCAQLKIESYEISVCTPAHFCKLLVSALLDYQASNLPVNWFGAYTEWNSKSQAKRLTPISFSGSSHILYIHLQRPPNNEAYQNWLRVLCWWGIYKCYAMCIWQIVLLFVHILIYPCRRAIFWYARVLDVT